jgi:hypothetical protein
MIAAARWYLGAVRRIPAIARPAQGITLTVIVDAVESATMNAVRHPQANWRNFDLPRRGFVAMINLVYESLTHAGPEWASIQSTLWLGLEEPAVARQRDQS